VEKTDGQYLNLLKTRIVETMKQSYPGISDNISDWKGQDIINFQEDLLEKINEYISEKWFYTHMKSENKNLPRIDMLNFLSRYADYIDWRDFKYQNRENILESIQDGESGKIHLYLKVFGLLLLLVISILLVKYLGNKSYQFAFKDAHTKRRITDTLTEIIIINDNESPVYERCEPPGYFILKTKKEKVTFLVKSPYYETDTITRILDKFEGAENIYLKPNDFALMIHYFSATNVKDWKKRRVHLDRMISDSAFIYQFFDEGQVGMELYNKEEFIDKLTMPVNSLKNIEIMETIYTGRKISVLRFKQIKKNK
jgi:hypothetical protein